MNPSDSPTHPEAQVLRSIYRRLYWAPSDVRYWREIQQIRTLVYLGGGGIGDSLNCSAVVHELDRRDSGSVSMMTPHTKLFSANPEVRSLHPYDFGLVSALKRWNRRVIHPDYKIPQGQPPLVLDPASHIVFQLCRNAGVSGEVALRPYFHFHPGEKERFAAFSGVVVVQSSCLNARHVLPAKNWPANRMQMVVNTLRARYRIVQTGHANDIPLDGAEDMRGNLSLRDVAALLANARFFVGLVGFLMHLSRAVETRSVIVYGGREHPLQSGYISNENVTGFPPCAPCGIDGECQVGHICMQSILSIHVLEAIERLEARLGPPLETTTVCLN